MRAAYFILHGPFETLVLDDLQGGGPGIAGPFGLRVRFGVAARHLDSFSVKAPLGVDN